MNIPRIFANAIVRRLAYVVVAMALAWIGLDDARAACSPVANTGGQVFQCAHEGEARSAATAYANANLSQVCAQRGGGGPGEYGTAKKEANYWQPGYHCVSPTTGNSLGTSYYSPIYNFATSCLAAPPLPSGMFLMGSGPICQGGCEYASSGAGNTTTTFFPGTPDEMQFQDRHGGNPPTGNTCDPNGTGPRPVTEETCKTVGNLTQCLRPDGKHCAQASTGKKFCWQPNEAGTKQDQNDAATKAPTAAPNNPPQTKPPNNGDWVNIGSGTTNITNNTGQTTNYTTNVYQSSSGPTGAGGGSTNPDGSENPGPGDGGDDGDDDHGTVNGDGQCGGTFSCSGGDPVLCAIAQQQYNARCEADGRFDGEGNFPGDGDGGAGPDPEKEAVVSHHTVGLGLLDEGGLGVGGGCPDLGSFNVMGRTIELDPNGNFCQIIGVARACLILLGAFIALGLLVGRDSA